MGSFTCYAEGINLNVYIRVFLPITNASTPAPNVSSLNPSYSKFS